MCKQRNNDKTYQSSKSCERCQRKTPSCFLSNDHCVVCSRIKARLFQRIIDSDNFNKWVTINDDTITHHLFKSKPLPLNRDELNEIEEMFVVFTSDPTAYKVSDKPCRTSGHVGLVTKHGTCVQCMNEKTPRQKAIEAGLKWYTPTKECPKCGTRSQRRVDNGRCKGCHPPKKRKQSRRAVARSKGEMWYVPEKPCPQCRTYGPRRVNNNLCRGCNPEKQRYKWESETAIMKNAPDAIITLVEAYYLKIKVYRTGEPCERGHRGWRYRSSRQCVDCVKLLNAARSLNPRNS